VDKKKQQFCVATLRRSSFRWKTRAEAQKKFKVQIGTFKTGRPKYGWYCNYCGIIDKQKNCKMDHIIPVVGPEGFTTLDDFADRLLCDVDNWQNLCKPCHDEKSKQESDARKEYRIHFQLQWHLKMEMRLI
jgi:5-methylcytosine-specific restriction endonuclease McrA